MIQIFFFGRDWNASILAELYSYFILLTINALQEDKICYLVNTIIKLPLMTESNK